MGAGLQQGEQDVLDQVISVGGGDSALAGGLGGQNAGQFQGVLKLTLLPFLRQFGGDVLLPVHVATSRAWLISMGQGEPSGRGCD